MAFGIFMHRIDSKYDDSPAERYQFPRQYLSRANECVGDWIVYLEPKRVSGTRGYFAAAKVEKIIPDPAAPEMYLAVIAPATYLDFPNPVQFGGAAGYVETGVLNESGAISDELSPRFDRYLLLILIVSLALVWARMTVCCRGSEAFRPPPDFTSNKRPSRSSRWTTGGGFWCHARCVIARSDRQS